MTRKNCIIFSLGLFCLFYLYFGYFYVSNSRNILLENKNFQERKKNQDTSNSEFTDTSLVIFPEYKSTNLTFIRIQQQNLWNSWLKEKDFVSVGQYYNHCDEDNIVIGEFVMVPKSDGHQGVKFQSHLNVTWAESTEDGLLYVDVWYGGIRFLKYQTSLCASRKSFKCPLRQGQQYNYVADFKVPFYVPSGHYQMKVYAADNRKNVLLCFMGEAII